MEVVVPDLGDFSDVEVIEIAVKPGDIVEAESPLITLETDKAAMDVPSPAAGRIVELKVARGDRVSAGDPIAVIEPESAVQADGTGGHTEPAESAPEREQEKPQELTRFAAEAETIEEGEKPHAVVVPDLGDFSDVEVIELLVAPGDKVDVNDGLITLETDKAAMDVPSPVAGVVETLSVAVGDRVSAGDDVAIILTKTSGVAPAAGPSIPSSAVSAPAVAARTAAARPAKPAESARDAASSTGIFAPPPVDEVHFGRAHASPSVRKLARELGVDLGRVKGSGRKNRVTADDVKSHVKRIMLGGAEQSARLPEVPKVDFAAFGEIDVKPLTRIQKISGPRLHASWINIPHVTQNDAADITAVEDVRKKMKARAEERGVKLTPLAFVVRACALALEEFPAFKSSLAEDGQSLVYKHYTHIGFAADTPDGLVVPVIRDADKKSILEIAGDLGTLSAAAREGRLRAAQMQGGVFTISSLGGIGGTSFTPIINAPEVAILGVSRNQWQPVYRDGEFVPRLMLPLSLSYDHRVIDGAQAVRFTTRLGEILSDAELLIEGAGQ